MDCLSKNNAESQDYGRVMTFGLSETELEILHHSLLSKNTEVFDTDVATDLVAVAAEVIIIKADALDKEGRELLLDYYNEVADYSDEVVFWIGEPCMSKKLINRFRIFASFNAHSAQCLGLIDMSKNLISGDAIASFGTIFETTH